MICPKFQGIIKPIKKNRPMKPTHLLLALLLIAITQTLFAKVQPILELDTNGHTGIIYDIIPTHNGEIISASDDKTIRVWDARSGKEKRKILGNIGKGSEGKIFAIALSNNEKYLAVGGYLSSDENKEWGNIRIYNYHTGKLIKLLKSHSNVVMDLSFSRDDSYLISGSFDRTAKIWSVKENFTLSDTITFHTNNVNATKIILKNNHYYALTAGWDNQIALYDMQRKNVLHSHTLGYRLRYLAINETLGHIAASGDGREIKIYDFELNEIKTIPSQTKPHGLNYSNNTKYLIAGAGTSPRDINIYTTHNYTLFKTFKKHTNSTKAVNFITLDGKSYGISGGGNNYSIYIWDYHNSVPNVIQKIEGKGSRVWSVAIAGDTIAWGNKWTERNGKSKLQKSINLNTFTIEHAPLKTHFNRISTSNGRYFLNHSHGGDYGYRDAVLEIKKDGNVLERIVKNSHNGYRHRCYGWYKDFIISGEDNGHLKVYTKEGIEVASLVGHTGAVWSIAVEGDRLVSGSGDQTIKVWNLSALKRDSEKMRIFPTLSIFVSKNDEYVVWSKEGFFNASKGGAKYIGYHINQGEDKEAQYVGVDKLYNTYYRPDLIAKALGGEDVSQYAKNIDIHNLFNSGLAPEVKILSKSKTTKKRDIKLELQVCTIGNGGYDNLTLYLNGLAVDVLDKDRALKLKKLQNMRKNCFTLNKIISLQSGKNVIGFNATNSAGNIESNTDTIKIDYTRRSHQKPNLYILAIGVDEYRDGDLWLKYSKADANAFVDSIQTVSKALFNNIYSYKLLDRDVTKSNVLETFKKIGAKTTREDVFILYMAGHGITDVKTGAYFYLPVDFRYKNDNSVRVKGISQNDFKLALSKIQAMKSLTILDTCNSGSFSEAMASRGVLQKTAIYKLTRATGRATIVASSKDQVALEGYKGHGVFTYTLIEALKGKGYGTDNKITIKELASYIEDVLPDRTYDKWGYEQVPQSNISGSDFPIGVK